MARKSYIKSRRNRMARMADAVEGPATPALRPAVPDLLTRAVALVEASPAQAAWEDCESIVLAGTGFRLRRLYRAGVIPSSNFDVIVLYNPDRNLPAFPVATLVGTQYKSMTDIAGFQQWMKLQGVTA